MCIIGTRTRIIFVWYLNIYKYIFTCLGTMIILLLLLAFLHHNGMATIKGYEEVEKSLLLKLGTYHLQIFKIAEYLNFI